MRNYTRNFDSAYVNVEASHERGAIMLRSLKIFSIFDSSSVSIARRIQLPSRNVHISLLYNTTEIPYKISLCFVKLPHVQCIVDNNNKSEVILHHSP